MERAIIHSDLTKNGMRPSEIRKKYFELYNIELKRPALTGRLKKLKENGIIIKKELSTEHFLTMEGLNISSILADNNI